MPRFAGIDLAGTEDFIAEALILVIGGYGVYTAPNAPLAKQRHSMIAALMGTCVGRWIASVAATVAIIAAVLLRTRAAGRRADTVRRSEDSLEAQRSRVRIEDEVDEMGRDRRRDELSRWVRDDGR